MKFCLLKVKRKRFSKKNVNSNVPQTTDYLCESIWFWRKVVTKQNWPFYTRTKFFVVTAVQNLKILKNTGDVKFTMQCCFCGSTFWFCEKLRNWNVWKGDQRSKRENKELKPGNFNQLSELFTNNFPQLDIIHTNLLSTKNKVFSFDDTDQI